MLDTTEQVQLEQYEIQFITKYKNPTWQTDVTCKKTLLVPVHQGIQRIGIVKFFI